MKRLIENDDVILSTAIGKQHIFTDINRDLIWQSLCGARESETDSEYEHKFAALLCDKFAFYRF